MLNSNLPHQAASILGVLSSLGLLGRNSASNRMSGLSGQISDLSSAQGNPGNPLYQQLYGQQKQKNINDLTEAANTLAGQNRNLTGMGRTPLFDAERGGEQMFRGLTQGYQNADVQAQNQTNDILQQRMNALRGAYGTQQAQNGYQVGQNNRFLGGIGSLADILKKGIF